MSNYGWTNADGEPMMDGAAWRFEQQLDQDSYDDGWSDPMESDYDPFGDEFQACASRTCDEDFRDCGHEDDESDPDDLGMEDAWLDGSYEM